MAELVETISLHARPHLTAADYSLPCFLSSTNPCATIQSIPIYASRRLFVSFIPTSSLHKHHTRYPLPLCTHVLSTNPPPFLRRSPAFQSSARNNFASKCKSYCIPFTACLLRLRSFYVGLESTRSARHCNRNKTSSTDSKNTIKTRPNTAGRQYPTNKRSK